LGGQRDAVGLLAAEARDAVERRAPAAADVEDGLGGVHLGEVVQDADLALLRLLEREIVAIVERGGGVVHVLVEPEREEVVAQAVRVVDLVLRRGHGWDSLAGRGSGASPYRHGPRSSTPEPAQVPRA